MQQATPKSQYCVNTWNWTFNPPSLGWVVFDYLFACVFRSLWFGVKQSKSVLSSVLSLLATFSSITILSLSLWEKMQHFTGSPYERCALPLAWKLPVGGEISNHIRILCQLHFFLPKDPFEFYWLKWISNRGSVLRCKKEHLGPLNFNFVTLLIMLIGSCFHF